MVTNELVGTEPPARKRSGVVLATVLAILALSLLLNAALGWQVMRLRGSVDSLKSSDQLTVGTIVPPIKAIAPDHVQRVITFFESDRPTILYFFAPGCDTCERNIPLVKSLADRTRGEYNLVGLSLADEELERYVHDHGFNFPVYSGLGVEAALAYKLGRVPQTTVVSREGRILANWYGPYDGRLRPAIEAYFDTVFPTQHR
jgi:thiol-disulfide isomerase/thioredoxin